jgi:predicted permease
MGFLARWRNSFRKDAISQDAADELAWHLEQRMQEYLREGLSLDEARAEAKKRMGNVNSIEEETVETDTVVWLDALRRDLKLALRMLRRAPAITIAAVLSLGLGIGANTVVFTLMKQVVLDYLPVPAPEQLVILHSNGPEEGHTSGNGMKSSFSYPLYRDLDAATGRIFDGVVAFDSIGVSLNEGGSTETVHGELVSGNFFPVLQVTPWRGRMIASSDDQKPGSNPVVVLGFGLWQRAYGSDPSIVNRTVLINKHPYMVIGVAPRQFYGIDVSNRADLFVPMSMKADVIPGKYALTDRLDHWCRLMARLKPGVTVQQAAAALKVIYPPLRDQDYPYMKSPPAEFRRIFSKKTVELTAGGQGYAELRDELSNPLKVLTAMVGLVLLITVVNVANLLIARGVARQREMAVRLSLGASKMTLARQLLIESLVLASMGGTLGVAIAYSATPALLRALSFDLSSASISAHPDWRVMLFAGAVTILTGILFGLLPAAQSTRTDVAGSLKAAGSYGHSGHAVWLRRSLVIGQVALSLVLLTSAILFSRSLQKLEKINLGFNATQLVKFRVNPLRAGYSQSRIKTFGEELRHKLEALPEVEGAALATVPLMEDSDTGGDVTVEGMPSFSSGDEIGNSYDGNTVSPGYFSVMQIPVMAGRQFNDSDSLPTSRVAVVNQAFVKHYLPGRNPIGVHFHFGSGNGVMDHTIVGVVADSKHTGIRSKIIPFIYRPYLTDDLLSSLTYYVRVRSSEQAAISEIRQVVHRMDSDIPVNGISPLSDAIDESLFVERSLGYLSIGFAALATILAIVGLYGVMSYSVSSRERELGIRMAIGATPDRVLAGVLRESAYLGMAGVVCGLPFVLAISRYIQSSLYGVQPNDPVVWVSAMAVLVGIAVMAGLVPARSAARIDPHLALRAE